MAFESRQLFLYQITLTATMAILIQIIITPVAWCAVEFEFLQIKYVYIYIHTHIYIYNRLIDFLFPVIHQQLTYVYTALLYSLQYLKHEGSSIHMHVTIILS